jgi:hypothetical protein
MRWGALFDDFESQVAAAERAALEAHASELVRAEQSLLALSDRLRGHRGAVEVVLQGGFRVRGQIAEVAEEWCTLEAPPKSILIPLRALVSVSGLSREARVEGSRVRRTLSLGSALRALARDRARVACHIAPGHAEPVAVSGMIDVVGRDYVELTLHSTHERAAQMVRQTSVIPMANIVAITSVG